MFESLRHGYAYNKMRIVYFVRTVMTLNCIWKSIYCLDPAKLNYTEVKSWRFTLQPESKTGDRDRCLLFRYVHATVSCVWPRQMIRDAKPIKLAGWASWSPFSVSGCGHLALLPCSLIRLSIIYLTIRAILEFKRFQPALSSSVLFHCCLRYHLKVVPLFLSAFTFKSQLRH